MPEMDCGAVNDAAVPPCPKDLNPALFRQFGLRPFGTAEILSEV